MKLENKRVGFCLTGSFCTFKKTKEQMKKLIDEGAQIIPIMSEHAYELNTKFGEAKEHIQEIEEMTNKKLIVAPCSRKYNC